MKREQPVAAATDLPPNRVRTARRVLPTTEVLACTASFYGAGAATLALGGLRRVTTNQIAKEMRRRFERFTRTSNSCSATSPRRDPPSDRGAPSSVRGSKSARDARRWRSRRQTCRHHRSRRPSLNGTGIWPHGVLYWRDGRGAGRSVPVVWGRGSVRRSRVTGDEAAVAARKVHRFVAVVPEHAVMLTVVLALAPPDFHHFAFAAGLADVGAFDDDPVTGLGVHGEPPFSGAGLHPSTPQGLRAGDAVSRARLRCHSRASLEPSPASTTAA
jgi:hypothetical protein